MKITCLIENSPSLKNSNLFFEHGLSFHISFKGHSILFDMGQSDKFIDNALKMGVDVSKCDLAILSHHHYDHGGGIERFLQVNKRASVYLKPQPQGECYSHGFGKKLTYIGLNNAMLIEKRDRFTFLDQITEIKPDIFIITHIDTPLQKPKGNRYLFLNQGGHLELDPFEHELILVIKDSDDVVVFTGCAHNGIINMLKTVKSVFPKHTIKAVIGGFHLITLPVLNITAESKKDLNQIAHDIDTFNVDKIYTGHCTGKKAFQYLKKQLNKPLFPLSTGEVIRI